MPSVGGASSQQTGDGWSCILVGSSMSMQGSRAGEGDIEPLTPRSPRRQTPQIPRAPPSTKVSLILEKARAESVLTAEYMRAFRATLDIDPTPFTPRMSPRTPRAAAAAPSPTGASTLLGCSGTVANSPVTPRPATSPRLLSSASPRGQFTTPSPQLPALNLPERPSTSPTHSPSRRPSERPSKSATSARTPHGSPRSARSKRSPRCRALSGEGYMTYYEAIESVRQNMGSLPWASWPFAPVDHTPKADSTCTLTVRGTLCAVTTFGGTTMARRPRASRWAGATRRGRSLPRAIRAASASSWPAHASPESRSARARATATATAQIAAGASGTSPPTAGMMVAVSAFRCDAHERHEFSGREQGSLSS